MTNLPGEATIHGPRAESRFPIDLAPDISRIKTRAAIANATFSPRLPSPRLPRLDHAGVTLPLRRLPDILLEIRPEALMGNSQRRAIQNYRSRLSERGLARFEVLGRDADRDLIRSLARRLAEDSADASRLRAIVGQAVAGEPPRKGGILAALRRSPLVGADLDLSRRHEEGRKVDL
jgi:hypothetical protein